MSRNNNPASAIAIAVGVAGLVYGIFLFVAIAELVQAVRLAPIDPLRYKAALLDFAQTVGFIGWAVTIIHLIRRYATR